MSLAIVKSSIAAGGVIGAAFAQVVTESSPAWLDAGVPISAVSFAFYIMYQMVGGGIVAKSTINDIADRAAREAVDRILRDRG